ncbi:MAG TPA: CaiB/BaiF CoA-transferase family protein [Steroidobacteraceae bacterium]|nr:CaiB/BaiF CoA-transferase family protein [Steroidobacteraceae bacterium]
MSGAPASRSALTGVRVLALETSLSGPHCTKLLADLGAEVIKIEKPGTGDVVRGWDSAVKGLSSGYVFANGNKRSLAIDVKSAAGIAAVKALAERVDVFVENFAPGVAQRLGLGHAELCSTNPRLIYCSISGYGQDGPYRDVKAYDLLIQGEAGIIATTGYPDRPAKVGVSITDLTSSMYAAVGILGALYQRGRTGRGQVLDISMFESAVSWLGYFPHHYWHKGEEPARVGMRHHYITPYGPYLAADGQYVNLAVATESDWTTFCRHVIERAELLEDSRFRSPELRRQHRAVLEELIEGIFLEHGHEEWLRRLAAHRLPHGRVNGIADVLGHPQVSARHFIREVNSPVGPIPVVGSPLRLSDSVQPSGHIPALGEDTEALLRELGYADADIAQLRGASVI